MARPLHYQKPFTWQSVAIDPYRILFIEEVKVENPEGSNKRDATRIAILSEGSEVTIDVSESFEKVFADWTAAEL